MLHIAWHHQVYGFLNFLQTCIYQHGSTVKLHVVHGDDGMSKNDKHDAQKKTETQYMRILNTKQL